MPQIYLHLTKSNIASHHTSDETDEAFFRNWGVEKLKCYLLDREVPVGNTNKEGLINLCVFESRLGFRVVQNVQESLKEVERERIGKLRLEDGRIILSDPDSLVVGWEEGAQSYLELCQIVEKYWDESE